MSNSEQDHSDPDYSTDIYKEEIFDNHGGIIDDTNNGILEASILSKHVNEPTLGFFQRFADVIRAGKDDIAGTTNKIKSGIAVSAAIGTLGWEVGPGNETTIPRIGRYMLELGHTGVKSVTEIVAVTGVYTFAQQMAAGGIMAAVSLRFRGTAIAANKMIVDANIDNRKLKKLSLARQIYYSFFFGSGFTVTREVVKAGEVNPKNLMKVVGRSAIQGATTVGIIAGVADASADNWPEQPMVDFLVYDVVGNPWVTGLAATGAICYDGTKGLINKWRYDKKH